MPADSIHGFPFFALGFDKDQKPAAPHEAKELLAAVKAADGPTDLFVVSHGWNNDVEAARALYDRLFGKIREALDSGVVPGVKDRRFAVAGVFWPSMKFAEADLIPGGAAGAEDPLAGEIRELMEVAPEKDVPQLKQVLAGIGNPSAQTKSLAALRKLVAGVPKVKGEPEPSGEQISDLSDSQFLQLLTGEKAAAAMDDEVGGVASAEGRLSGFTSGVKTAVGFYTFWSMKDRAGKTGANGLTPVLNQVRKAAPNLRIHLAGHSFGARLVTAAADVGNFGPSTMTLMQAAFSHNGFSPKGVFRKVVTEARVKGPTLITHTIKDRAVGLGYPVAVRLAFDSASALGDKNDKYGGLGRNGAQLTAEAVDLTLHGPEAPYKFDKSKRIFNLQADNIILNHGDLAKPQLAYAMLSAIDVAP